MSVSPQASPPLATPWVPLWPLSPGGDLLTYADPAVSIAAANMDLPWTGGPAVISYLSVSAAGGSVRSIGIPPAGAGTLLYLRIGSVGNSITLRHVLAGGTGAQLALARGADTTIGTNYTITLVFDGTYWVEAVRTPPPVYATSLPAAPVDGQEAILVDSLTYPNYVWRFRYNAGSTGSYKWEYIGGTPRRMAANTGTVLTGGIQIAATGVWYQPGMSMTVPRSGFYRMYGTHTIFRNAGALGTFQAYPFIGTTFISGVGHGGFPAALVDYDTAAISTWETEIAGGTLVGVGIFGAVANTYKFGEGSVVLEPIRVA